MQVAWEISIDTGVVLLPLSAKLVSTHAAQLGHNKQTGQAPVDADSLHSKLKLQVD